MWATDLDSLRTVSHLSDRVRLERSRVLRPHSARRPVDLGRLSASFAIQPAAVFTSSAWQLRRYLEEA